MKILLASLCLALFGHSSFAQSTTVLDPKNVLAQVDAFVGTQSFDQRLACESKARYFTPIQSVEYMSCGDDGCAALYTTIESNESNAEVHNCSSEGISIYFDNGKIWDISKADYDTQHGNLARLFLMNWTNFVGFDGEVTVLEATPAQQTIGNGSKIDVLNVTGRFRLQGEKNAFEFLMSVAKDAPGVAQISRLRIGTQSWVRLKEY